MDKRTADLDEAISNLRVRFSKNEQVFLYLDEHIEEKEALEREYGYVSDLERTCRGSNNKKLTFEQYVLGSYFQDILCAANVRLGAMTSGRYELFKVDTVYDRRKTNSLDIEVLDHYTGKKVRCQVSFRRRIF